jgi:hypothetical protein
MLACLILVYILGDKAELYTGKLIIEMNVLSTVVAYVVINVTSNNEE